MKKLITIVLTIFMVSAINAQIKNATAKIPGNTLISSIDPNLNLEKIKNHLKSGDYCYDLNLASTAIVPPKTGGVRLVPIVGYFSTSSLVERSNQLAISGNLLINTNGFRRGDGFTVFLGPESRDATKINKQAVYITWDLPSENLRTIQLKNVTIEYKPYGILIIGDYDYDGLLIAVSMTLTPKSCLI